MKLIDALARVLALDQPAFRTSDASVCLRVERRHASKILERLADAGHLLRLARALWGVPGRIEAFALPEYLAAPFPAYVSLHSALFHHGMVSQIPSVIYAVTVGRARRRETPIGVVSFHHVAPSFFFGFESHGRGGIKIASPEKALLDVLYLGAGRSEGMKAPCLSGWPTSLGLRHPDYRRVSLHVEQTKPLGNWTANKWAMQASSSGKAPWRSWMDFGEVKLGGQRAGREGGEANHSVTSWPGRLPQRT